MTTELEQNQPAIPREAMAMHAYELYCDRGCKDGHDVDDWLQAEVQLREQALAAGPRPDAPTAAKAQ